jgi:starch synthase
VSQTSRPTEKSLRILFAAAEADPIVKVGGLGDVTGSLPQALRALSQAQARGYTLDIRLALPYHAAVSSTLNPAHLVAEFSVPHPAGRIPAQAFLVETRDVPVYLIQGDPIRIEPGVYSLDTRKDGEKYTFFSLAILELAQALDWQPHILHAHDWHTALSVHALHLRKAEPFFSETRSVLTVHNLPFMGGGTQAALSAYGIPAVNDSRLPEWGGYQPLPMGLAHADFITTVSPTYAQEILTPEFGSGLQDFLQMRAGTLAGILNGLDEQSWDPQTDTALAQPYSAANLALRAANKQALQREMGLPEAPEVPLLIFIGRMDWQKGVDLAVEALRQTASESWQAILLGTGDPNLQSTVQGLETEFSDRIKAAIRFDAKLSRRMYAGADMLVMPSRYEPCGLAQMIAMRYGCVPVARATGGLRDTIIDGVHPSSSTGYLFEQASPEALAGALRRALADYHDCQAWQARQTFGMQQDFSWRRSAESYAALYARLSS